MIPLAWKIKNLQIFGQVNDILSFFETFLAKNTIDLRNKFVNYNC